MDADADWESQKAEMVKDKNRENKRRQVIMEFQDMEGRARVCLRGGSRTFDMLVRV